MRASESESDYSVGHPERVRCGARSIGVGLSWINYTALKQIVYYPGMPQSRGSSGVRNRSRIHTYSYSSAEVPEHSDRSLINRFCFFCSTAILTVA